MVLELLIKYVCLYSQRYILAHTYVERTCFLKDIGEKANSSWMGFLSVGHRNLEMGYFKM